MKRIVTLLLAAGIVFGAYTGAQAADIKVKGSWDFSFEWLDNAYDFQDADNNNIGTLGRGDELLGKQRFRSQIDIVASETLSGTVYLEIGDTVWGSNVNGMGGDLGTDGIAVEVKRSYIDWMVPDTQLQVRMGLQGIALPGFVAGSPVLDDDVAALALSYAFNDTVAATAVWARPYDLGSETTIDNDFDEMDLFALIVPINLDGMKIAPWGMYSIIGKEVALNPTEIGNEPAHGLVPVMMTPPAQGANFNDHMNAWWGGLSYELSMFDPFKFRIDGVYGSVDTGDSDYDRAGWLIIGQADYKLDMVTPGLFAWYGSGDDSNLGNGSELMPYISPDFGPTSFGMDRLCASIATDGVLSVSGAGTWGVGIQAADLTFIENLSHVLRVTYYNGTNDKKAVEKAAATTPIIEGFGVYLTEEDNAIEVNFDTTYKIYENLTLLGEVGYIHLNMDDNVWNNQDFDNAWKLGLNFQYAF